MDKEESKRKKTGINLSNKISSQAIGCENVKKHQIIKKFSRTLEQSATLSMSSPTAPGQIPGTSSSLPEMNRYDHPGLAADTFSDPLLRNGSFVDGSNKFSTSGHTTVKSNGDSYQAAPHSFSSANAMETETPTPKQPKSRRKVPVTMSPGASESANWLPPGWLVEDRVRISGATAGTVDKVSFLPKLMLH